MGKFSTVMRLILTIVSEGCKEGCKVIKNKRQRLKRHNSQTLAHAIGDMLVCHARYDAYSKCWSSVSMADTRTELRTFIVIGHQLMTIDETEVFDVSDEFSDGQVSHLIETHLGLLSLVKEDLR